MLLRAKPGASALVVRGGKSSPQIRAVTKACHSLAPSAGLERSVFVAKSGQANCEMTASKPHASHNARDLVGRQWRDRDGERLPIGLDEIMVVTPFNAQIRAIQRAVAGLGYGGLKVGTVDKFQGREAPVVIYSMATSSADDAPRGMEFLYDLHRLNVATSRAKAMAVIVASPDLVRVACQTTRQMVLANALCQAWESGS